ncbi:MULTISPECIES: nucleoside 2-deoxyribosyltransferase [unclassified Bradyrhizobium]|uniref:nucleoside 2-deoxyribosyltransferase n=1 Tax=unclassified Bradyrhizobium TaxID=2631580 RepID=UPI0028E4625E|nr:MULTISPECIES: nucleoside 2-deoxyribosyltransferase [unclassified Bradyrhizobium]
MQEHDIYLASPLFSEAERDFNAKIAIELRRKSFSVFLPQELPANHDRAPTEAQIFCGDTRAVLDSRLLLAVLDGETTDAGVATEIGIALSHHIPIVGLWTDIRQARLGSGRMYRNIYVTGAIQHNGKITNCLPDAVTECERILSEHPHTFAEEERALRALFEARCSHLQALPDFFKSAYQPAIDSDKLVADLITRNAGPLVRRIVDFGCGVGRLSSTLKITHPDASYLGIDALNSAGTFPEIRPRLAESDNRSADVLVLSFVAHDYRHKRALLETTMRCLVPGGIIVVVDLEKSDLASLTTLFEQDLLRIGKPQADTRLSFGDLQMLSLELGISLIDYGIRICKVTFPNSDILFNYIQAFGIDAGYDLGLVRCHELGLACAIKNCLARARYPFVDSRSFIYGVFRWTP